MRGGSACGKGARHERSGAARAILADSQSGSQRSAAVARGRDGAAGPAAVATPADRLLVDSGGAVTARADTAAELVDRALAAGSEAGSRRARAGGSREAAVSRGSAERFGLHFDPSRF